MMITWQKSIFGLKFSSIFSCRKKIVIDIVRFFINCLLTLTYIRSLYLNFRNKLEGSSKITRNVIDKNNFFRLFFACSKQSTIDPRLILLVTFIPARIHQNIPHLKLAKYVKKKPIFWNPNQNVPLEGYILLIWFK